MTEMNLALHFEIPEAPWLICLSGCVRDKGRTALYLTVLPDLLNVPLK